VIRRFHSGCPEPDSAVISMGASRVQEKFIKRAGIRANRAANPRKASHTQPEVSADLFQSDVNPSSELSRPVSTIAFYSGRCARSDQRLGEISAVLDFDTIEFEPHLQEPKFLRHIRDDFSGAPIRL
jgi:hypothetical protein